MHVDFLVSVFKENLDAEAMVWKGTTVTYSWILDRLNYWLADLEARSLKPGTVVVIVGDYSPNAIALMLALIQKNCIVVPLTVQNEAKRKEYIDGRHVRGLLHHRCR